MSALVRGSPHDRVAATDTVVQRLRAGSVHPALSALLGAVGGCWGRPSPPLLAFSRGFTKAAPLPAAVMNDLALVRDVVPSPSQVLF